MTYYLVFGLVLVISAAGIWVRRRASAYGHLMILAGCIGFALCLAWQIRESLFPPAARAPDRGQAVVAYFLANHFLGETGRLEGRVLLLFPPPAVMDDETVGTYSGTFKRVLRGLPGLDVQIVRLELPKSEAAPGPFHLQAFRQATSRFSSVVGCVSFAGLPPDFQSSASASRELAPPIFVFDPWSTTNWLAALKSGAVRCVIVPRPGIRVGRSEALSGEPREVLDQLYLVATLSNAEEVAAAVAEGGRKGK